MKENIFFLCSEEERERERKGYIEAFSSFASVTLIPTSIREKIQGIDMIVFSKRPDVLIHADNYYPRLPLKMELLEVPTVCFHFDTYSDVKTRIEFSSLFDYVFVSHPEYVDIFRKAGLTNTFSLPHAVQKDQFEIGDVDRDLDIGWVGRLDGHLYRRRRELIELASVKYKMNDINRYYNYSELSNIYRRSKIGINFSRTDFIKDANLRCFEIMGGGALLLTGFPTELDELGFKDGIHYVSYKSESELLKLIDYFLDNTEEREKISKAGHALTLREHTYDARAAYIMDTIENNPAPPRRESARCGQVYLNYCYKKSQFGDYLNVISLYREIPFLIKIKYLLLLMMKFVYLTIRKI